MRCLTCGERKRVNVVHHCPTHAAPKRRDEDDGSFAMGVAIGAATDNALIGGFLSGSLVGGMVGDLMGDGSLF